jgi:hypothetical protein
MIFERQRYKKEQELLENKITGHTHILKLAYLGDFATKINQLILSLQGIFSQLKTWFVASSVSSMFTDGLMVKPVTKRLMTTTLKYCCEKH